MGSVYPEENCNEYMKENEILGPVTFFLFALKFLIVRNVCTNVHDKWITTNSAECNQRIMAYI